MPNLQVTKCNANMQHIEEKKKMNGKSQVHSQNGHWFKNRTVNGWLKKEIRCSKGISYEINIKDNINQNPYKM